MSVAQRESVPVWDLIDFNFGTRAPEEVNWYLRRRVGCDQTTPDGLNYRFSSGATPGIIHLPPKTQTTSPAKPNQQPAPRPLPNLHYGKLGIRVAGSDTETRRTKSVLDWIAGSETGAALLTSIGETGKTMTIRPFDLGEKTCTANNRNAFAMAEELEGAVAKGERYYQSDDPKTPRDERFDGYTEGSVSNRVRSLLGLPQEELVGTGEGSDVVIEFSQKMWGYGNICSATGGQPGASPSQVLLHEMVHGYRMMRGHFYRFPTSGGNRQYDNEEEFHAIVVSNVYTADPTTAMGNRTLRAHHQGFTPLPAAQLTSAGFMANFANRSRVQRFASEEPGLITKLKPVKGPFNPFAAL